MLTLELLICTIDERIIRVPSVLCPPQTGVKYLVSWQRCRDAEILPPAPLTEREDVRIVTLHGKGLSANRNNALRHASGDVLLFVDDDCRYTARSLRNVVDTFERHPEASVITFQATDFEGNFLKAYSPTPYLYEQRPRGSYVTSFEIAVRRCAGLPPFDVRFGLGAPRLSCGEEEVFVHEACRKGLVVRYEPLVVAETTPETTGKLFLEQATVQQSKGAVHCVMHGCLGALLRGVKILLTLPPHSHRFRIFRNYCRGVFYILCTRHDHD